MTTIRRALPTCISKVEIGGRSRWGFAGSIVAPNGRFSLSRAAAAYALLLLVLPSVAAIVYYLFIASPIYISETRFAIRSVMEPMRLAQPLLEDGGNAAGAETMPVAGNMTGLGSRSHQDPFIVASFMMSPDFVMRLDSDGWLREIYGRESIDPFSRLAYNAAPEQVFAHWRRHVAAAVDRRSNAVLLRARAYSSEDAHAVVARALATAEAMLEDLTSRQRADTLALARTELAAAEKRYTDAILGIEKIRGETRIVEPAMEVEEASSMLLALIQQRIDVESQRRAAQSLGVRSGPSLDELGSRIASLDVQIEEARARLTGLSSDRAESVLDTIGLVEELDLERQFARRMLDTATMVYAQALQEMERQSAFLLVYLEPTLPTNPSEPNPFSAIGFVFGLAALAWLFATTATAVAADQMS